MGGASGNSPALALMRFYLDENLSDEIAVIARGLGVDVISSHGSGRDKLTDEDQLTFAAAEGRCVVTVNRDDFIRLTNLFLAEQRVHAGVLIVPRSKPTNGFARIAHALTRYAAAHANASTQYLLDYLS